MKYIVTGGFGVIGSQITRKLLADGHHVLVIDPAEEPRNKWIWKKIDHDHLSTWFERLELTDDTTLGRCVEDADAVIHCAASTGIPYSVTRPSDDWERNVDGTRALLEALRVVPRPTVVLSSVKPYRVPEDIIERGGLREDDVLEPDEGYAASKAAQSMLCMAYARSYGIPIVTFRCSNLYGPNPSHGARHGWLTWFCISAAIGRAIEVQGDGTQSRDMLHADDVFSACMLALENADKLKGQVFNIGGGVKNRVTVGDAAERLRKVTGVEIVRGPARVMDDKHVFVDYGKFSRSTGWKPNIHVLEGIRQVLAWAQENSDELRKLYEGIR